MSTEVVECTTCGANMIPQPDGRTYACDYCSATMLVAVDGAQLARGMQLDLSNADAFLHRLAETLEGSFRDRTKIQRQGAEIMLLEVDLEHDRYVAKKERGALSTQHKKVSRGIALKTTQLALQDWVDRLADSLAAHANQNARATAAIEKLFGRR